MVKKLIGCGIAAALAASLWGAIPQGQKKVLKDVRALEGKYRAALTLCDVDEGRP